VVPPWQRERSRAGRGTGSLSILIRPRTQGNRPSTGTLPRKAGCPNTEPFLGTTADVSESGQRIHETGTDSPAGEAPSTGLRSASSARRRAIHRATGEISLAGGGDGRLDLPSRSEPMIGRTVCANARTYGSVGARGGQPPRATRTLVDAGLADQSRLSVPPGTSRAPCLLATNTRSAP
jgi:hypothetical protein